MSSPRRRMTLPPGYQPSHFHAGFIQYYNMMRQDEEDPSLTDDQLIEKEREHRAAFERHMTEAISRDEVSPADREQWRLFQERQQYLDRAAVRGSPENEELRTSYTHVLNDPSNPLAQGMKEMATRARAELNGVTDPAQRRAIQERYMNEAMALAQKPENAAHLEAMVDRMASTPAGRKLGIQTSAERRAETNAYMAELERARTPIPTDGTVNEGRLHEFMSHSGHSSFSDPLASGSGARVSGTSVAAVGSVPDHGLGGLGAGGGPVIGGRGA